LTRAMSGASFDYTISFERDATFYPDATELAKIIFAVLCVMFTSAISLKYYVGEGTQKYRKTFMSFALLTMVAVQYYQLWFAVLEVPIDFASDARRYDCLNSNKGGKVQSGNTAKHSVNPCFCHANATCTLSDGSKFNVSDPAAIHFNTYNSSEVCVDDAGATCEFQGLAVERFLEDAPNRDCDSARGDRCSLSQPCTPCEYSAKSEFGARWSRCATCTAEHNGDCNFVPGVGPYCYKGVDTREVVPCVTCCTEKFLEFDAQGVCS